MSVVFLGTGAALNQGLGNSACVVQKNESPWLLIDCGHDTLTRYREYAGELPRHTFITHLHFDHIAGLEQLYYQTCIHKPDFTPTVFVPSQLVNRLTQILSNTGMAETGINVWDAIRIVPVFEQFWFDGCEFKLHAVRHHKPNTAFALQLPGSFFYTGDTRPIPEILHHEAVFQETIFHDATLVGNPSHSGIDELLACYNPETLARLVIYHYPTPEAGQTIAAKGVKIAQPGEVFHLRTRPTSGDVREIHPPHCERKQTNTHLCSLP